MSNESVRKKMGDYLAKHPYMNLATVAPDGRPVVHTVAYVSEGTTCWFITDERTRKVANIAHEPRVAYTVDEDELDWGRITGLQVEGCAVAVEDPAEAQRVMGALAAKFPAVQHMPKEFAMKLYRVEPTSAIVIDNTEGHGHRDTVTF